MLSLPQAYFDTETKTNTGELLILKKTIDIVKHISCAGTSAPTAFPTAFPTTSPTALSNTPTSFPTRAPTAVPTGAPTANPTAALSCTSGTWMFMSKVFANPDRFGVPAYADGVVYNIPTTMGPDTCAKIETSHSNVGSEGVIQTIMHQYKCCGNSGSMYGSISYDDGTTTADANQLCESADDHCDLFGANMDWVDATSVTDHATSANSNYDITNQE